MTAARAYKTIIAATVALSGTALWVVAALSPEARAEGASLWVVIGAAVTMAGLGSVFVALGRRPR